MVFNIVSEFSIAYKLFSKAVINRSENNTPCVLNRDHLSYFYRWLLLFK